MSTCASSVTGFCFSVVKWRWVSQSCCAVVEVGAFASSLVSYSDFGEACQPPTLHETGPSLHSWLFDADRLVEPFTAAGGMLGLCLTCRMQHYSRGCSTVHFSTCNMLGGSLAGGCAGRLCYTLNCLVAAPCFV